jgi:hypothetical protein
VEKRGLEVEDISDDGKSFDEAHVCRAYFDTVHRLPDIFKQRDAHQGAWIIAYDTRSHAEVLKTFERVARMAGDMGGWSSEEDESSDEEDQELLENEKNGKEQCEEEKKKQKTAENIKLKESKL